MSAVTETQRPLPRLFGDYDLIEEVGRGGMGVIYKAHQRGLDRLCAIKMLKGSPSTQGEDEERLREEAKAAARLDHPNIVGIYEVGEAEGQFFFSMEFVEGDNLATFVRSRTLSANQAATYVKKIAEAIQYAHGRGVLHCDLKPANVLIDYRDEPQITDFGLARRVGRDNALTEDGEYGAGSPNFMAPEQVSDRMRTIGPYTDVFGIGATLYYLLTDRPPFRGETCADTINAVLRLEPVRPRALRPGVPVDLETICLKCLEKRPAKRYRTAQEVADELQRFLNDEPIHARQIPLPERAWRYARRRPLLAGFAAAILGLLLVVAVGSFLAAYHIDQARQVAEKQRARAEANELRLRQQLYAANMLDACQAAESGDIERVTAHLARYNPAGSGSPSPEANLRGWEWRYLSALSRSDEIPCLSTNDGKVVDVTFFRDARHLITLNDSGVLRFHDLSDPGKTLKFETGGTPDQLSPITLSPDGSRLAFGQFDPKKNASIVRVIDSGTWTEITRVTNAGLACCVKFSPDNQQLMASYLVRNPPEMTSEIVSFSLVDGSHHQVMALPTARRFNAPMFSRAAPLVAFANDDASITVRYLDGSGKELHLVGHEYEPGWVQLIIDLEFSPNGKWLVSTGVDKTARVWDLETQKQLAVLPGHSDAVLFATFSPDQSLVATGSRDRTIRLWEMPSGRQVGILRGRGATMAGLSFSPDGQFLVSGNQRGEVSLWNPKAALAQAGAATPVPRAIVWAELLPDAQHWWTSSEDSSWNLYQLGESQPIARIPDTHLVDLHAKTYDPASHQLAIFTRQGKLTLRNLDTGVEREFAPGRPSREAGIRFSPDGQFLGVSEGSKYVFDQAETTNLVQVWQTSSGQLVREFASPGDNLLFSRDNRFVASCDNKGKVQLNDMKTGASRKLAGHNVQVHGLAFSPGNAQLATGGLDGSVKLWDTADGSEITTFQTETSGVLSVEFSPDGSRLVCGSLDGQLQVWDLNSRLRVATFRKHRKGIGSVFFADADTLISGGLDEIRTWKAEPVQPSLESESSTGAK